MTDSLRLDEIGAVVAIYEHGSIQDAARALGTEPRRLNDRLLRAEKKIRAGHLIDRYQRPAVLTAAGRRHWQTLKAMHDLAGVLEQSCRQPHRLTGANSTLASVSSRVA